MTNENKTKEKYFEYQMIQQQVMQLQKQMDQLEQQRAELLHTIDSLTHFNSVKNETLLTPVASGIFVKTKVESVEGFLVNVGEGVVVKKDLDGVLDLINKHLEDLEMVAKDMNEKYAVFQNKMLNVESEIQEMTKNV